MAYGLQPPPDNAETNHYVFKQWFSKVVEYVLSRVKIKNTTAAMTVEASQFYIRVDATGGARTITLPSASTCSGRQILVAKIDSSGNAVTVARAGTDTIEGSNTISLASQWDNALLISNGNNGWERIV